jgi:hypothetical protein
VDLERHLPAEVAGQTVEEQLARLVALTCRAEIVAPLELRIMVHLLIGFHRFLIWILIGLIGLKGREGRVERGVRRGREARRG